MAVAVAVALATFLHLLPHASRAGGARRHRQPADGRQPGHQHPAHGPHDLCLRRRRSPGSPGAVMAPLMSVDPQMGVGFLIPAFLSILVGGTGSLLGALLGTTLIAGSSTVVSSVWTPDRRADGGVRAGHRGDPHVSAGPDRRPALTCVPRRMRCALIVAVWACSCAVAARVERVEADRSSAQLVSYGIFAMSLSFVWGQAGLLCFGQAIFFGMGAYAMAVLTKGHDPGRAVSGRLTGLAGRHAAAGRDRRCWPGWLMFRGRGLVGRLLRHRDARGGGDRRARRQPLEIPRRLQRADERAAAALRVCCTASGSRCSKRCRCTT